jgi:hypothetical protein
VGPPARWCRVSPDVHPCLAGHGGPLGLAKAARHPARAGVPTFGLAPVHLVFRLLGPPDDRRPVGHIGAPAGAPAPVRDRRAQIRQTTPGPALERPGRGPGGARQGPSLLRVTFRPVVAQARDQGCRPTRGRALDRGPPGGGRFLGRDPAADGLLHDRLGPPGLPPRPPGHRRRFAWPRRLRRRRRVRPAHRGVPVPCLGHRSGRNRPIGRGYGPR